MEREIYKVGTKVEEHVKGDKEGDEGLVEREQWLGGE